MSGHISKKNYENPEIVVARTVGVWEHTDSWLGAQIESVLKPIQTLKNTFESPRSGRNIFSRHQCLNLPEVLGDPSTAPPHPSRRLSFQFWRPKSNIWRQKSDIYSAKTQICAAKIHIFDPKFKYLNFCTTKNLPLCTRKTPGAAVLTPTHPTISASKKLKRPPLGSHFYCAQLGTPWEGTGTPH